MDVIPPSSPWVYSSYVPSKRPKFQWQWETKWLKCAIVVRIPSPGSVDRSCSWQWCSKTSDRVHRYKTFRYWTIVARILERCKSLYFQSDFQRQREWIVEWARATPRRQQTSECLTDSMPTDIDIGLAEACFVEFFWNSKEWSNKWRNCPRWKEIQRSLQRWQAEFVACRNTPPWPTWWLDRPYLSCESSLTEWQNNRKREDWRLSKKNGSYVRYYLELETLELEWTKRERTKSEKEKSWR